MKTRREAPVAVDGKSGRRWKARYTAPDGRRVSAGTFKLRGPCRKPTADGKCCAQHAIDAAYDTPTSRPETFGAFAETWTRRYPRGAQTNRAAESKLRAVLDVEVKGRKLRDWPYAELRRRHIIDLVDDLLVRQGRAAEGARGVIRVLSAMTGDAMDEELTELNAFAGVKIRDDDPRVTKAPRKPRVYTMAQMHAFAAAVSPQHEGMVRALSDCGLRLGEMLGLDRADFHDSALHLHGTVHNDGTFHEGNTSTKHHVRRIPLAPQTAATFTPRIDSSVLFPTPNGKRWLESNFYKWVWRPGRRACPDMAEATPQDFRHSWVSHMRAAGIDGADLAKIAGHSLQTQNAIYLHAYNRSDDAVRAAIG